MIELAPLATLFVPLQIVVVDLLLSADNALVIALACRGLPEQDVRFAAFLGTAGAIGLRIAMAAVAVVLLYVPFLKLLAALALLAIAVRLTLAPSDAKNRLALENDNAGRTQPSDDEARASLLRTVVAIVLADAIMSLDNVVAVATLADGNLLLLGFGLALSIPMLIWGSTLIRRFLDENQIVVIVCGMFLGWLAGGIGVSDPIVAPWIAQSAPALLFVVPVACAVFVMWQTFILAAPRDLEEGLDVG